MLQYDINFLGIFIPVIVHERLFSAIQIGFCNFGNNVIFQNCAVHSTCFERFGITPFC